MSATKDFKLPPWEHEPPTARQKQILSYIVAHIRQHQMAPTYREIQEHFDIASPNGVVCHVQALVRKGLLAIKGNGLSRSITVVHKPGSKCPFCGR